MTEYGEVIISNANIHIGTFKPAEKPINYDGDNHENVVEIKGKHTRIIYCNIAYRVVNALFFVMLGNDSINRAMKKQLPVVRN